MSPRRRYSDAEKADALVALDANGGNVIGTSRLIGIPEKTLEEWSKNRCINADVAILREGKREDLADRLESIAHALLDSIESKIPDANLSNVSVSFGIAVDKMRLLREQPTSINASLTDDERADRIASLFERARARRDGRPALRAV